MDLNRITLSGRSGAAAELKYTQNGYPILHVSIAVSKNVAKKDEQANWQSTWHKIVVWGKTAERMALRIKKGSKLFVEGELVINQWEKDGVKHRSPEIHARTIEIIERENVAPQTAAFPTTMSEEDIPF